MMVNCLVFSVFLDLALRLHSLFQKGSKADSNKSKKIFVGGIPHNCGEPELREYFNRFGVVSPVKMVYTVLYSFIYLFYT